MQKEFLRILVFMLTVFALGSGVTFPVYGVKMTIEEIQSKITHSVPFSGIRWEINPGYSGPVATAPGRGICNECNKVVHGMVGNAPAHRLQETLDALSKGHKDHCDIFKIKLNAEAKKLFEAQ